LSSTKKIPIEELNLKSDEEAIAFVKKLKELGRSILYVTDGENRYLVGRLDADDILVFKGYIDSKIERFNEEIKSIRDELNELKIAFKAFAKQKIEKKIKELPPPTTNESTTEVVSTASTSDIPEPFTFVDREESEEKVEVPNPDDYYSVTFKCPSCNREFTTKVRKGKKIVHVKCPSCGETVYRKGISPKKLIGGVVIIISIAFAVILSHYYGFLQLISVI